MQNKEIDFLFTEKGKSISSLVIIEALFEVAKSKYKNSGMFYFLLKKRPEVLKEISEDKLKKLLLLIVKEWDIYRDAIECFLTHFASSAIPLEETKDMIARVLESEDIELIRTVLVHPVGQMLSPLEKVIMLRLKPIMFANFLLGFLGSKALSEERGITPDPLVTEVLGKALLGVLAVELFTAGSVSIVSFTKRFFPENPLMEAVSDFMNRQIDWVWKPVLFKRDALIVSFITKEVFSGLFSRQRAAMHASGPMLALEEAPAETTVRHAAPSATR